MLQLIHAAEQGDTNLVTLLLSAPGLDLNMRDNDPASGASALIWAAASNHVETCKTLLDSGLELNLELKCFGLGRVHIPPCF